MSERPGSLRYMEPDFRDESPCEAAIDPADIPVAHCVLCSWPVFECDLVSSVLGPCHEECAEARWPDDPNRDPGIPKY